jgi:4-amino-4-deoxy-L-arabinose transferase-like glycosyltransferase
MKDLFISVNRCFNRIKPAHRFSILLIFLVLIYQYPSILFKRPQSVHHWRQSDCASLALNYYQTGMHFFQPQTHNLTSNGNTSGYVAPSEIPIGYYSIAILYKIFGYHDFIYRIVNTLIFLVGLFFLFKTLSLLIKGFFWPAFLSLFFFTSPVLVYYGNNFLTDSSALAFSLIAWYFFIKYYQTGSQKGYYLSMLFFLIAGAYKITALISLMALLGIFLIEILGIFKYRNRERLFPKPLLQFIPFIAIFIVIGAWVFYAKHYNTIHNYNAIHKFDYFSTGVFPIWDYDRDVIQSVFHNIKAVWLKQYFLVVSLYFMAIIFLINLIFIKKGNQLLITTTFFIFLGSVLYAILQFWTFKDHDYYTINIYILLIFNVISFAWLINRYYPYLFNSKYAKAAFLFFFSINVVHAHEQMNERYFGWFSEYPEYKDYHTITPYLRSIGIQPLDTVICLPDMSHFTLYLMNQRGWTEFKKDNRDSASVAASIKRGAKYLIVNGNEVLTRPYLQSFLYHPFGGYGAVRIFKLDNKVVPASFNKRIEKIICGAERLSGDGKYFVADSSGVLLEYGHCRSAAKKYSGEYSACLTPEDAFAMTYRFRNVTWGEHYIITVFRWSEKGNGTIVASAKKPKDFYLNVPAKTEKLPNGWEKLTLDFYTNVKTKDGELAVYLWNDGKTPVYFDDLTIIREY